MWPNPQEAADLVTFTEYIFTGNLHFCAVKEVVKFFSILKELKQKLNLLNLNEVMMGILTHFWPMFPFYTP